MRSDGTNLGVASKPTEIFEALGSNESLHRPAANINGNKHQQFIRQRSNLFFASFIRMVRDILRFNRRRLASLIGPHHLTTPWRVCRGRQVTPHYDHYIIRGRGICPMVAGEIWLAFPLLFCAPSSKNHGLLSVNDDLSASDQPRSRFLYRTR